MDDVLRRLRDETREEHQRVERATRLDTRAPNPRDLHRFIERMGGFAPTLVRQLSPLLRPRWPDDGEWPLNDALEEDIRALQLTPMPPGRLPEVTDESAAWGAAYVLEGASLGRRVLARTLGPGYGHLRYLGGASEEGDRWARFRQALTGRVEVLDPNGVVAAARDVFEALEEHLRAELNEPQ